MDAKILNIVMARHDHPRKRDNLNWEQYLYRAIANDMLSMCEVVEIAHAVNLPDTVQAKLEIRCYARAGATKAVERATARYHALFAQLGQSVL